MIIIIPLGGLGVRFKSYGYDEPKPLIKCNGDEIISKVVKSIKFNRNDKLYIIYNYELDKYGFNNYFTNKTNIYKYRINYNTKGPVETTYDIINSIAQDNIDEKIIFFDGDTFYNKDILKIAKKQNKSSIFYSKTTLTDPIYSYIRIKNQYIIEIKEKQKISNSYSVGCYLFDSVKNYLFFAKKSLKRKKGSNLSDVYNEYLKQNIKIKALKLDQKDFNCLGTPKQLIDYCTKKKDNPKIFCFDLDNTLISNSKINNNFSTFSPIEKNIKIVNFLKKSGHKVIINTSRKNDKSQGKLFTIKQLNEFRISYDELIFGKPNADFYIDDLAINANQNLEFKLGYYDLGDNVSRPINEVLVGENFTTKKSKSLKLQHEIKYLKNLPKSLKLFFPKVLSSDNNGYKMDTVKGVPYSYLYTTNLLKERHIENLLNSITYLHNYSINKLKIGNIKNIYNNYYKKLNERLIYVDKRNRLKYGSFFKKILNDLKNYEKMKLGKKVLIHGDPVFSNIILTNEKDIVFIDPRGSIDGNFSLVGDINYDFAKIYQSLVGYDFILMDKLNTKEIIDNKLISFFIERLIYIQPETDFKVIKLITASLYLTLIKFHKKKYESAFIKKAIDIYEEV